MTEHDNQARAPEARPLTEDERAELLGLARAAIVGIFAATAPTPLPPLTGRLGAPGGAFVTLRQAGRLRGCIGVVEPPTGPRGPQPLAQVVRDMAVRSAARDPRFEPLTAEEADDPALEIEVSVLTPPQPVKGPLPDAIEVGRHGLMISGRGRRGLLLPQVASDRGWTAAQFLDHTCLKAGLPADAWRAPDTQVRSFTAEVF